MATDGPGDAVIHVLFEGKQQLDKDKIALDKR